MAAVKGSKQYEMHVVPHRPAYRAALTVVVCSLVGAAVWVAFDYGKRDGLALRAEVIKERDAARIEIAAQARELTNLREQIADLTVGEAVDTRANEEVLGTMEDLQNQIADLNEEIRFYKGVMLPNAGDKGLRIERLDVSRAPEARRVRYKVLLTQVVDKHEYVQGGVEIVLRGRQDGQEVQLALGELGAKAEKAIRFRFRYFQNIDGELMMPEGFEPSELLIVARSSGGKPQRLERTVTFDANGGLARTGAPGDSRG